MLGLIVLAVLLSQDDAAAAELLKKVEAKVMQAETLHIEYDLAPEGRTGRGGMRVKGELKIGGGGTLLFTNSNGYRIESDGRLVRASSSNSGVDASKWTPAGLEKILRRAAWQGVLVVGTPPSEGEKMEELFEKLVPQEVKAEGKEKVGEVEASVVSFQVGYWEEMASFKLWIDPVTLSILKRQLSFDGTKFTEKTKRFDLEAKFPEDLFEFQTADLFKKGRTLQLARAVALHARYTGRPPKTLEDLKKRPADLPASVFWPETGFWIGGDIPKDIPYSIEGRDFIVGSLRETLPDVSPVGAPTERLRKFFTYRVLSKLLKDAGQGFATATTRQPSSAEDLLKKPEIARFWPEGGWIGGGKFPLDPWGDAFEIGTAGNFSVALSKPSGRLLKLVDLTADERKGLEGVAFPALGPKGPAEIRDLMGKLGASKLEDREAAMAALIDKGGGVLPFVTERLATEQDPEVASRLGVVADHFRSAFRTWMSEVKGLRYSLSGTGGDVSLIPVHEGHASDSLKMIANAQSDFFSNDRDGNRNNDYYVRDVAGLFGLVGAVGTEREARPGKEGDASILKLITPDLARADTTEDRWEYPTLKITDPVPDEGYFVAALRTFDLGSKPKAYHDGTGRNADRFGVVAYPAEYGVTGRKTFIISEDNAVWQKDLGGDEIDTYPPNPSKEGWTLVD